MPWNNLLAFPHSDQGFLAQYPVRYESQWVGPRNRFADGRNIYSAVERLLLSRWTLHYENLTNEERDRFEAFLAEAEGLGRDFLFFDPLSNLLKHSADLTNPVWNVTGPLDVSAYDDPDFGPAFVLTNGGTGAATLEQSVPFGFGFQGCFSVSAKWDSPVTFRAAIRDANGASGDPVLVSTAGRVHASRRHAADVESSTVVIEVPSNTQVILANPQLEVGARPAAHSVTGERSGLVDSAWLSQPRYQWTSQAPNAHAITLEIESLRR